MFVPVFFVHLHPYFLARVEVYLCTQSIMPFYILFFASAGHADIKRYIVSLSFWQSLHLLSVSVLSNFVAKYFVFNAWSCAATISFLVSAFNSPIYV